jgi:Predicted endonuclease containing a URI domain
MIKSGTYCFWIAPVVGKMTKTPTVYIMTNKRNGTLYIGVTSDIVGRVWEHKNKTIKGFSSRYGTTQLVWYEFHPTMEGAIHRETDIKRWKRLWKLKLVDEFNPRWEDLYDILLE